MNNTHIQRDQLRRSIRKQRRALSSQQRRALSEKITANLIQSHLFRTAKHIAYYLPVQGEADPTLALHHPLSVNKHYYLPVISKIKHHQLFFAPIDEETEFFFNQYKIPEPICHPKDFRKAKELDIILTPLVGFDQTGNRLGMGGGYYDRSFAFKRFQKGMKKPWLIGYAYEFQGVDTLPSECWDVPLDAIVTDTHFIQLT